MQSPALRTDDFFRIKIKHVPTRLSVSFEGWVTQFADQYKSSWDSQQVYGRMDPLATFSNTNRDITLSFDVVSDSLADAASNLDAISQLIKFQYPVYRSGPHRGDQNTLRAAPLIQMQWTNLISSADTNGLLTGYMGGVNYSPDVEQGGFIFNQDRQELTVGGEVRKIHRTISNPELFAETKRDATNQDVVISNFAHPGKSYIPKKVNISLQFTVLHTHLTGWYSNKEGKYFFGSEEVTAKYPNQLARRDIMISQTAAPADSDIVGTINFQRDEADILGGE